MAKLVIPNSATLHQLRGFIDQPEMFRNRRGNAILEFHPRWAHMEPIALSMTAAWGARWQRQGKLIQPRNLGGHTHYAARMKLFEHLGIEYHAPHVEHEEAGRFLPITRVSTKQAVGPGIGNISALLHLYDDP